MQGWGDCVVAHLLGCAAATYRVAILGSTPGFSHALHVGVAEALGLEPPGASARSLPLHSVLDAADEKGSLARRRLHASPGLSHPLARLCRRSDPPTSARTTLFAVLPGARVGRLIWSLAFDQTRHQSRAFAETPETTSPRLGSTTSTAPSPVPLEHAWRHTDSLPIGTPCPTVDRFGRSRDLLVCPRRLRALAATQAR
jgi:hypothetical protein